MTTVGPTQQQVHIDQPLTNISVGYSNGALIADRVFPQISVDKQSNKYFVYTKEYWFRNEVEERAPGTRAERADYGITASNYTTVEYALAKGVPDSVVMNADNPIRPLAETTTFLTNQILLNKEILVAQVAFGNSQWAASATPATLWDVDTSDPIGDAACAMETVEQALGQPANIGVIGGGLWRHVKKHPDLIDRVKGAAVPGNPALLNTAAIAALFDLEQILVGRGMQETGPEGGTSVRSRIWGLHMAFLYRTPTPSLFSPNAGYIFEWGGRQTNRYREDQEHQDVVEVVDNFVVKLVSSDSGYLIKSAASA